ISKSASISPVFAQILINRGIKTPDNIKNFLTPSTGNFSDPFELPDMDEAVEKIKAALIRKDRVFVHGDYDTDGLTATAIMVYALRKIGLDVYYFIPDRAVHGYGFNPPSVDTAMELGAKLIITVDCGITSFDAAEYAKKNGIGLIITDHHEPRQGNHARESDIGPREYIIPGADAVVNPKIADCPPTVANLSGAGVALKVAQALAGEEELPFSMDDSFSLLDLAALGTVADIVPLTGENRIILKEGLRQIRNACRPGVKALKDVSGLDGKAVRAGLLSFTMVPRINAAGRIADAGDVIRLLLSETYEEGLELSEWLNRLNSERQKIEGEVCRRALAEINRDAVNPVIVLAGEGWHEGVLGIVASRIAEEFHRPAFIFSVVDGIAKGSARSIPSFDIVKGLTKCGNLLLSFGGHKQAAGIRLKAENIPAFDKAIQDIMLDSVSGDDLSPSLSIDAAVTLPEINHGLIKELGMLEPLGYGNPEPLLGAKMLEIISPRIVGNNHIKMKLRHKSCHVDAIGFGMGRLFEDLNCSTAIDAVFTPVINEWNGGRYIQLILKAFRPSY
ncbi:MAG: single-stranded-DNA-specific exonuclease RecJ, partial [Nitrospirota bacterium]|nr:single-stranded-DNA-specific exonuclease RecJ [Nitrospirota bacterium]